MNFKSALGALFGWHRKGAVGLQIGTEAHPSGEDGSHGHRSRRGIRCLDPSGLCPTQQQDSQDGGPTRVCAEPSVRLRVEQKPRTCKKEPNGYKVDGIMQELQEIQLEGVGIRSIHQALRLVAQEWPCDFARVHIVSGNTAMLLVVESRVQISAENILVDLSRPGLAINCALATSMYQWPPPPQAGSPCVVPDGAGVAVGGACHTSVPEDYVPYVSAGARVILSAAIKLSGRNVAVLTLGFSDECAVQLLQERLDGLRSSVKLICTALSSFFTDPCLPLCVDMAKDLQNVSGAEAAARRTIHWLREMARQAGQEHLWFCVGLGEAGDSTARLFDVSEQDRRRSVDSPRPGSACLSQCPGSMDLVHDSAAQLLLLRRQQQTKDVLARAPLANVKPGSDRVVEKEVPMQQCLLMHTADQCCKVKVLNIRRFLNHGKVAADVFATSHNPPPTAVMLFPLVKDTWLNGVELPIRPSGKACFGAVYCMSSFATDFRAVEKRLEDVVVQVLSIHVWAALQRCSLVQGIEVTRSAPETLLKTAAFGLSAKAVSGRASHCSVGHTFARRLPSAGGAFGVAAMDGGVATAASLMEAVGSMSPTGVSAVSVSCAGRALSLRTVASGMQVVTFSTGSAADSPQSGTCCSFGEFGSSCNSTPGMACGPTTSAADWGDLVGSGTSSLMTHSGAGGRSGNNCLSPRSPHCINALVVEMTDQVAGQRMVQDLDMAEPRESLSQIRLIAPLGTGGYSSVFKGTWRGMAAAIKVIRCPSGPDDSTYKDALSQAREIAVLSSVSHPNINQAYTFIEHVTIGDITEQCLLHNEDGGDRLAVARALKPWKEGLCHIMVLELCDAGSMAAAINEGYFHSRQPQQHSQLVNLGYHTESIFEDKSGLTLKDAAPDASTKRMAVPHMPTLLLTLLELASALEHLHSLGIVHCDIKPDNVMLKSCTNDRRGFTVRLADFGLSRLQDSSSCLTFPCNSCGSVAYLAPEAMTSGHMVDNRVDVYSFGVLMWELYTADHAFQDYTPEQIVKAVRVYGMRPRFPVGTHTQYMRLAQACWDPLPGRRPCFKDVVSMLNTMLKDIQKGRAL